MGSDYDWEGGQYLITISKDLSPQWEILEHQRLMISERPSQEHFQAQCAALGRISMGSAGRKLAKPLTGFWARSSYTTPGAYAENCQACGKLGMFCADHMG